MPRFAANITFLFTELPFLDRFQAAAEAGFTGVEFHYPYAFDADEVRARLDAHALTAVLINVRAGDPARGEWGFAGLPGHEETFRDCVEEAIDYAQRIGVRQLNCLAGVKPADREPAECERTLVDNLRYAAKAFATAGLAINVEPLNTFDVPDYLLPTSSDAMRVLRKVSAPNARLQYDWYHMHRMERGAPGGLAATMRALLPFIGHMQFADAPGRHEPGTGEIDFPGLCAAVDAMGYAGWLAAEYRPSRQTRETLGWMPES